MRMRLVALLLFAAGGAGCGGATSATGGDPGTSSGRNGTGPDTTAVALFDLRSGTYLGFTGGLYPDGTNTPPSAQSAEGLARAARIRPLDVNGVPKSGGKVVLLSVGMSNTSQEFCAVDGTTSCFPETFMGRAAADNSINRPTLVIVNGAQGGRDASTWLTPSAQTFDVVRDQRLAALNVTEKQVEIVWLSEADENPTSSLPNSNADAYVLENRLGSIVRALHARYPNLQQVFIGSRNYGGYAKSTLNPEPYAYESGFSTKWLVQAQIEQMQSGRIVDARAGDLNYTTVAPWVAWGPYTWADGTTARSDGLVWLQSDFGPDGTHPSESGRSKAGALILSFFKTSQFTRCWFVAGVSC
jgi:hypothetical protein